MLAMTPRFRSTLAAMALLLFATAAPAPVVGLFPGLSNLIAYSEDIVVAQVVTGPEVPRLTTFNASQPQIVRILYVLKGSLRPQSEETVMLDSNDVLGVGDFEVGERYLLFLRSDASSTYLLNYRGSAFRVPATTDFAKPRSNDVRANIVLLLNDVVKHYLGPNAAVLKKEAAEYLESP